MAWQEEGVADTYAEAVCRLVKVDGLGRRCPIAVLHLLRVKRCPLPGGELLGHFNLDTFTVHYAVTGTIQEMRARAAHELGHVILAICGKPMPHDEFLASRVGRAVCMGRMDLLHHLAVWTPDEVVKVYSDMFLPSEIMRRAWEVDGARRQAVLLAPAAVRDSQAGA